MSRIFLSHSSKDNFAAVALGKWLRAEGWDDVFLDVDPERGIAAGERWERKLHEAATRCEAVVFLISADWLASGWCLKEYTLARGLNKKLFAVLIDPGKTIADLPPELTGAWQVVDLAHRQDMVILRVASQDSHEEQHVAFSREGLRRLKVGLENAGLDPRFFAWPPPGQPDRAPYRGLQPIEAADAGIFFGRDAPIVAFSDALRGLRSAAPPRLLVILGASGAGKSSFLRAGLLPRLARDDSHFLPLPPIRPEHAALTGENGLLAALETICVERTRADLRAAIKAGAAGVRPVLAELAAKAFRRTLAETQVGQPPTIVIAVDQAEELFRPEGGGESAALLELLRDLTAADDPAAIAIFAIRSDSYDALQNAKALVGMPQLPLSLPPMPRNAYREVIEGPARRVVAAGGKLAIEPQLTERLLEEIENGSGKDALPLLAFTLEQLYREYGRAGLLRLEDYEAFGGLRGTIDAAVERAFRRADGDPRIPRERAMREALVRRGLIPWLAGVDPDTKRPRRNIARRGDIPAESVPLIDLMIEERLLSTDTVLEKDATGKEVRVGMIEPTHESLLRQWGMLAGWLDEDFGLLAMLESVKRAARDWDANGRAEAWLAHQGQRLADAQGLDARSDIAARLDATDRAYLALCRAKQEAARAEAEQRRKEREEEQARRLADAEKLTAARSRIALITSVALVIAVILGAAAAYSWRQAKSNADAAVEAISTLLARASSESERGNVKGMAYEAQQAFELLNKLAAGGDVEFRFVRAQSRHLLGLVSYDENDKDSALSNYQAAIAEVTDLLKLDASDAVAVGRLKELADEKQDLGDVLLSKFNDPDRALAAYNDCYDERVLAMAKGDSGPASQHGIAWAVNKRGDVAFRQGKDDQALDWFSKARDRIARLDDKLWNDILWPDHLAVVDTNIGLVYRDKADYASAVDSFSVAEKLLERVVAKDPGDLFIKNSLSWTYYVRAEAQFRWALANHDGALLQQAHDNLTATVAHYTEVINEAPDKVQWQIGRVGAQANLDAVAGFLAQWSGDDLDAAKDFTAAANLFTDRFLPLIAQMPRPDFTAETAEFLDWAGMAEVKLGHSDEGRADLARAQDVISKYPTIFHPADLKVLAPRIQADLAEISNPASGK